MSMENDSRYDQAVYWESTGLRNKFAKPIVMEAVELLVRWEHRLLIVQGRNFSPVKVEAVVVVDRDIPEGSIFWKGALEDLDDPTDLMEVEKFTDVPDIKGVERRKVAYLCRYGGSLPDLQIGTGTGS